MSFENGEFLAPTAGELREDFQSIFTKLCVDNGFTPPSYESYEAIALTINALSQLLAPALEAFQGSFDQLNAANASGDSLKYLADVVGLIYSEGTPSTVTLTVGAWSRGDVALSEGTQARTASGETFALLEDVLIPSGGTAEVSAACVEVGPIAAPAGTITLRVSSVAGWNSVTNAADADPGLAPASDGEIRSDIFRGKANSGSFSQGAVEYALEQIPFVQHGRIEYNSSISTIQDPLQNPILPQGAIVYIYPDTIPEVSKQDVMNIIFAKVSPSTFGNLSIPAATGADGVRGAVLGVNGQNFDVGFFWVQDYLLNFGVKIQALEPSYTFDQVKADVRGAIRDHIAGLSPGEPVYLQDIIGKIALLVQGVARSQVEWFPSPGDPSMSQDTDIIVPRGQIAAVNSITVVDVT